MKLSPYALSVGVPGRLMLMTTFRLLFGSRKGAPLQVFDPGLCNSNRVTKSLAS